MTACELWLRLTYPLRRRRLERELREEIALHVALRAQQLEQRGFAAADAVLAARRRFGNASRIAAASRDAWGWRWLDGFVQDLRYVARQLRRAPLFVFVASLTIGLGVAVNAAAFTFYDAIVLKPLPVAEPERMIRVVRDQNTFGSELVPFAAYDVLRAHARSIQSIVTTTAPQSFVAVLPGRTADDSHIVSARFVSVDFFHALGVVPSRGRSFDAADDHAVVLGHDFWTGVLESDPGIVGRRIRIGDAELTVVGVAPRNFAGTGMPAAAPDLWLPASALPTLVPNADWRHDDRAHWQVLGRLVPGATLEQARSELSSLSRAIPDSAGKPLSLTAKRATFFQTDAGEFEVFQQVSAAFLVALTLILAIAAVNLVNLFAARHAAREREVSVRLAIGAKPSRIARQLASESVLIALVGGAFGLVLSHSVASWIRSWIVATLASVTGGIAGVFLDLAVDWRVALYAAALSVAIGLAVGVWPALQASRADVNVILRQGTTTAGVETWGRRNALLALQVASSLVLLTAAGMLLGGMRLAQQIDPGFDANHMLVVDVDDQAPIALRAVRRAEITRRLLALPSVRAVAWTRRVPFGGTHLRRVTTATGSVTMSVDDVSEGYFGALGLSIVRGRGFTAREVETDAPVMVVGESMARLRWPGGDAVGRSVPPNDAAAGPDTTKSYTVIGVVRDIRSQFLSRANGPSVYFPYGFAKPYGGFLVRTRGAPGSAINAVRAEIAGVDPLLAGRTHVLTMQDGPMALQRLMAQTPALIALVLALAGLALSSVGVYGLIAQIVTRRTREIGIHIAIGARPPQVVALVVRKTLRPVAWGAAIGGLGAVALSLFLRTLIATPDVPDLTFGAGAFNPVVFLAVLGALMLVVVAACYLPARRAARLDPVTALRVE
jgi:predicted permease